MLRILTEPVQSVAPSLVGVLKYAPTQARAPKGSGQGGQWVKGPLGGVVWQEDAELLAQVQANAKAMAERQERRRAHRAAAERKPAESSPTSARRGDIATMDAAVKDYVKANTYTQGNPRMQLGTRAQIKQLINKDITARLKDHPAFAGWTEEEVAKFTKEKIDLWAETSGDSSVPAVKMQDAVKKEFGLDDAAMDHLEASYVVGTGWEAEEARNRAFVRAEYERTQEWFKARGITHVSVFRGMGSGPGTDIGYENVEGDFGVGQFGLGYETVTMQPASSWSTDLDVAIEFGADSSAPVVLTTRVPVETVLATCVTGRGCYVESELILLGKPIRARVFDTHLREEEPYDALTDSFTQANRRGKQKILDSLR
jgi:hypothetical protein